MNTSLPEPGQTLLNIDQYRLFQQFIAVLSPEQVAWVGGYLTGLASSMATATGDTGNCNITLLVGSQTGNSEALAEQTQQLAASRGLKTVIKKMGDYKLPQLKAEKNLLVIVSTYGEGDPPDNSREMYEYLFSNPRKAERGSGSAE